MNKHVPLEAKLTALQENDTYRKWHSLDDERVCILCEKVINGRMIDIWESRPGIFHLQCPTPTCAGTPRDWFYHGGKRRRRPTVIKSRAPVIGFGAAAGA